MRLFGALTKNDDLRNNGWCRRIVGLVGGTTLAVSIAVAGPAAAQADKGKPASPDYSAPTFGNKPQSVPETPKPLTLSDKQAVPPAPPGNGPDIIGGTVASFGEFPYFVSVQTSGGSHFCGGSLMSTTKVLTAAHCVDTASPGSLRVSIGGTTLSPDNGVIRSISSIAVHPSWNPGNFQNDVAILTLSTPIVRTDFQVQWLRLARGNELGLVDPGDTSTVIGHGCCAPPDPNNLIKVNVPIQSDATMTNSYGSSFHGPTMVGAGPLGGGQDSCQGDSGGPLLITSTPQDIQIGDVSWGNGCALPNFPGVYGELYQGGMATFVNGQVARPANDNFASCGGLGGNAGSTTGSTENATVEPSEASGAEASVWYCWTPSVSGNAQIAVNQHGYDSEVDVYTGASVSALTLVAHNDDANLSLQSEVEFNAVAGTTYRIRVDGFLFDFGAFRLSYGVNRPANDDFAAAQVLSGPVGGPIATANTTATGEAGEPAAVFGAADASLWYSWTAPETGVARLSTHGSNFDTTLAAFTGTDLAFLTQVAANDDSNSTLQSLISFAASAGTTYRIQVAGFAGLRGNVSLQFTVNPPGNDLFTAAQVIAGGAGTVFGSNGRAIGEPGEPGFFTFPDGTVWYRWTSPFSGTAEFNTCGSNFDTVLAAATGASITGLTQVAVNDDNGSSCPGLQSVITFTASAGTTYQIWVDGFASSSRGNIQLNWGQI